MTRKQYDEQLSELKGMLIEMGRLNAEAVEDIFWALKKGKAEPAKKTKALEILVDEKESETERLCLKLILKQQPVASDLLFVTAAMKMITDMERIADQAEDIGDLIIKTENLKDAPELSDIAEMSERVWKMVCMAMEAFEERNTDKAKETCRADDAVDDLFEEIRNRLNAKSKTAKEEEDVEIALNMLMIAKYLERIGDHATNIAEWVLFMMTGEHKKLN